MGLYFPNKMDRTSPWRLHIFSEKERSAVVELRYGVLVLPLISSVALDKLFNLSGPQILSNTSIYLIWSGEDQIS